MTAGLKVETPDCVENRVFHEKQIRPGAICRRYHQGDETGEWEPTPWFAVISNPKMCDTINSEYVQIVWLDGPDSGLHDRFYLGDLGVKPPYRGVCEKHELEFSEEYVASSKTARFLTSLFS